MSAYISVFLVLGDTFAPPNAPAPVAWCLQAYISVHFLGDTFDVFRARLCYVGEIDFSLNLLKWFGLDSTQKLLDRFEEIVMLVKDKLIGGFKKLWEWVKKVLKKDPSVNIVAAVKKVPEDLKKSDEATDKVVKFAETLPSNPKKASLMSSVKKV